MLSYDAWMLSELTLTKFRAFDSFTLRGLGRVNLLVGTNNCGKTSVLEAISILTTRSVIEVFNILGRRGEAHEDEVWEPDPSHLFHGRLASDNVFSVQGFNDRHTSVTAEVRERAQGSFPAAEVSAQGVVYEGPPLTELELTWDEHARADVAPKRTSVTTPLSGRGGIELKSLQFVPDRNRTPVHFVTTEGLSAPRVISMFEEIVLTPDEEVVLEALRIIEPKLERIATIAPITQRLGSARGGMVIRLDGVRVPIGSLGDGIWRLLGIALALTRARGGILLVDEIDTGLHYSVLMQMWEFVYQVAKRLDVQVFATTHSRDCVDSLAAITKDDRHDISLHRIERGAKESVAFSEAELRAAAERNLEVR